MKAEELKNKMRYEIAKSIHGDPGDVASEKCFNLAQEYARIQIEKDREMVKDAVHESGLYHNHIGLDKIYKNTPINLD